MTSESWAGFSDEDIERIKSHPKISKSCADSICELDGGFSTSEVRRPMKIKNARLRSAKKDVLDDGYESNSTGFESKLKEVPSTNDNLYVAEPNSDQNLSSLDHEDFPLKTEKECVCNNVVYEQNRIDIKRSGTIPQAFYEEMDSDGCDEDSQSNASLPPLEVLEMRQKRMEAENARRRALINRAITDKKMQTQAEAMKLAKITQELNRIDSNFSDDVSILRDYIEKASLEFTEAEKRYRKVEKEYVDAKYILFQKMQRKQMLTEHLCAIIEQNENRKADKLVELMKQLEMEVIVDDMEVNGGQPILPNLCMLNNELYHCRHTVKPPLSKGPSQEKVSPEDTENTENQKQTSHIEESQKNAEVGCGTSSSTNGTGD